MNAIRQESSTHEQELELGLTFRLRFSSSTLRVLFGVVTARLLSALGRITDVYLPPLQSNGRLYPLLWNQSVRDHIPFVSNPPPSVNS
jgi:hypothetical protein